MPSIIDQCEIPARTRELAREGRATPCHRCLAYRPETQSGCLFVERGVETSLRPKRRPVADQTKLWALTPTPVMLVGLTGASNMGIDIIIIIVFYWLARKAREA